MEQLLIIIQQNLRLLYFIHIPAGFASMLIVSLLGVLALTTCKFDKRSLERRGNITYRLWLSYSILMFIVMPTASVLAVVGENSFQFYMALFLLYLNIQLYLALRGRQTRLFNRITIIVGLVVAYLIIGRGLLYAIQQQSVPATIVFFGVILAVISTIDLTTISHADRTGLIIRNGIGTTLVASTAMINVYVFRGDLAWFSWIIPTLVLTPIIGSTMFINRVHNQNDIQPHSEIGQRALQNIIAFRDKLDLASSSSGG